VPDAGEQPHHEQVADVFGLGVHPAAPQGEVDIVPEPGGQGDVPPPPEFGDGPGDVGVIEVLQEVEAEHLAKADGHVGVAGEIVVDLQGVAQGAQPGEGGGQAVPLAKGPVGHHRQLVGEEHLLAQTHDKPAAPGGEVRPDLFAVVDLLGHCLILDDGAGDELGEKGDVKPHLQGRALHLPPVPVDVQHIAQGLEGKEGDADGQLNTGNDKGRPQAVQNTQCKRQVFKYKQDTKIHRQGGHKRGRAGPSRPLAGIHPQAEAVIGQDGAQHDQYKPGLPPGIEAQGGQQQKHVLPLPPPPQGQVIHQQDHREE